MLSKIIYTIPLPVTFMLYIFTGENLHINFPGGLIANNYYLIFSQGIVVLYKSV